MTEATAQPSQHPLRRWLPLVLLLLAGAAVAAAGGQRWLSFEAIALNKARIEAVADAHQLLAVLVFASVYVCVVTLSLPGSVLMTFLGGVLFPIWICIPAVIVSATAGATLIFLIARSSLGEVLARRGGDALARLSEGIRRDAASYMLFLRLVPLFPFALVNLAPALVGVPLRTFVWTTFVGIMPASIAYSFAASSLDSLIDERVAAFEACRSAGRADCAISLDPSLLVNSRLLLAFAALGLLALLPVAARLMGYGQGGAARD